MPPIIDLLRPKRGGFTTIELIVALGVLLTLAMISLLAFSKVRNHSDQVKCVQNLKAWTSAIFLYRADNNDSFVPYRITKPGPNNMVEEFIWIYLLKTGGYLGSESYDIYRCPAFKNDRLTAFEIATMTGGNRAGAAGYTVHYGYNHAHIGSSRRYATPTPEQPAKGSMLSQPHKTLLLVETSGTGATATRGYYIVDDNPTGSHIPHSRHGGGLLMAFADGHVERRILADPATPWRPAPEGLGTTTLEGSLWKRNP